MKLSLQCRRILGRRKLHVYVRTVVTAIFVMTEEYYGPRSFWLAPFSPLFSSFNRRFRERARRKRLHCGLHEANLNRVLLQEVKMLFQD